MPCSDGLYLDRLDREKLQEKGELCLDKLEREKLQEKVDTYAQRLCRAMEVLERSGLIRSKKITPKMREWWSDHKELDRKRRKKEARVTKKKKDRRVALARVSKADRKLLGL